MLRWKSSLKPASGGGGVGTDPATLNGLVLQLNADTDVFSDAGITPAVDGDSVQEWHDQSGSGNDATNSGSGKPVFETTGIASLDTILWDSASEQNLISPVSSAMDPVTMLFVVEFNDLSTTKGFINSTATGGWQGRVDASGTLSFIRQSVGGLATTGSGVISAGTPYVIAFTLEAGNDWRIHVGSTVYSGTSTDSPSGSGTVRLGSRAFGERMDGFISDVYLYNQSHSQSDIADAITFLEAKYSTTGITLEDSASTTAADFSAPTDIDVNIPAVSANDILLMLCATGRNSDPTTSPPTGWTKIVEQDGTPSYQSTVAAYWKRASSSASATTETWSSFYPAAETYYIWVGAYSGCVTSGSPVDAYGSSAIGYGTPWSVNVTTTTADTMIVTISGSTNSGVTHTWSDGTELIDTAYPGTSDTVSINEKLEATTGSKTRTVTPNITTGNAMAAVALRSAPVNDNFEFTVTTTTASETFTIPCQNSGTFNATVDWGDGSTSTITAYNDADLVHTYATAGDHNISISGTFPNIYFNNGGDKLKVKSVTNLGSVGWTIFISAFYGCSNMTSFTAGDCDTSSVARMDAMFYDCTSLTSVDLSSFNTSSVTNMGNMFFNCSSLTSLDVSSFNTSSVTSMSQMFRNCSSLTSLDLSSFNTSSVTNMSLMFLSCTSLTSLDVSSFNTSNVTNMQQTFASCSSLTSLDVSSFNTSSVTNMLATFSYCSSLTSLDLSSFNTSSATRMDQMFYNSSSLTSVDLSSFTTSSVTNMGSMFRNMGGGTAQLTITGIEDFDITAVNANKMVNFMLGTGGLSTTVYDELLVNWEAQTGYNAQNPHFGGSKYTAGSAAATARADLVTAGWTITDGGTA